MQLTLKIMSFAGQIIRCIINMPFKYSFTLKKKEIHGSFMWRGDAKHPLRYKQKKGGGILLKKVLFIFKEQRRKGFN